MIDQILGDVSLDAEAGVVEDLYRNTYSQLTARREEVYTFLNNYGQPRYNDFLTVLQRGYAENIVGFIVKHMVPAKSNVESGVFIENDKLNDQKYQ